MKIRFYRPSPTTPNGHRFEVHRLPVRQTLIFTPFAFILIQRPKGK